MLKISNIIKAAVAVVVAAIVLVGVNMMASGLYASGPNDNLAEGEAPVQAYTIDIPDPAEVAAAEAAAKAAAEEAAAEGAAETETAAAMPAGDAAAGEKVFAKCKACHKVENGKNGVGPHLAGIVGRPVASVDGFKYSDAMIGHASEVDGWSPEALAAYLADPKGNVPGNKMAFAGLKKPEDIANIIAYLSQN